MQVNIAVTGSFCSGKTSICRAFKKHGFTVFNSDVFVHKILRIQSVQKSLCSIFGAGIIQNGQVDRKGLALLAFQSKASWNKLNQTIHPAVIQKIHKEIKKNGNQSCVFEIPLLFESGMEHFFDYVVFIDSSKAVREERAVTRGFSKSELNKRSRYMIKEKMKKKHSNFIITNNKSLNDCYKQVEQVIAKIKQKEILHAKNR